MESGFAFFFKMGVQHICDLEAYDHMLFLLALVAPATWKDMRALVGHVSAFTIGHCLTLLLAGLGILRIDQELIEFLIPISIACTATYQLTRRRKPYQCTIASFGIVLFFGLIHGAGFSNFFRSMFFESDGIVLPLLSFNLGVELGQIVILFVILGIKALLSFFLWRGLDIWAQARKTQMTGMILSALALLISTRWVLLKLMDKL